MAKEKCENCGGAGRTDPMLFACARVECAECRGAGYIDREADYYGAMSNIDHAVEKFVKPFMLPIGARRNPNSGETRQFIERMRQYLMVMELNADAVEK